MKTAFAGLTSRLDMAEERITGLEDISESLKTEKQREQSLRKKRLSKDCGTTVKISICV